MDENDDSWNLGNYSPVLNHKTDSLSSVPSLSNNPELDLNMKDPYLSSDKDSPVKKVTKKVVKIIFITIFANVCTLLLFF